MKRTHYLMASLGLLLLVAVATSSANEAEVTQHTEAVQLHQTAAV